MPCRCGIPSCSVLTEVEVVEEAGATGPRLLECSIPPPALDPIRWGLLLAGGGVGVGAAGSLATSGAVATHVTPRQVFGNWLGV